MGLALVGRQFLACIAMNFAVAFGIGVALKSVQWGTATFSILGWVHMTMMFWYYMMKDIKCE